MKLDKTLIAGPWIGEFGWELFAWHAYVRRLSRCFAKTIIICRDNSRGLYSDFADEFVSCNHRTGQVDSFFMHNYDLKSELKNIIKQNNLLANNNVVLVPPRRIGFPPATHYTEAINFGNMSIVPEYIKLTSTEKYDYDYVFHARDRDLRKEDNWSTDNWEQLRDLLGGKIASIGSKTESKHIENTDDLRGVSFDKSVGIIQNAKFVFGPSSGPMHLSSLCNTPHIVWSRPENRTRYQENWNPHKTPVLFLDEFSWHPNADYVYKRFEDWKKNLTLE
tara:strand:- start:2787 stop:3617 length:831 start_codon:yes stop_codon:yes gene_type:complete